MLLTRVAISGFRSIDATTLDCCGRFNVLIGKNNSGKSNVLAAILGFFDTMSRGTYLQLRPRFRHIDDFFDRNPRKPIEVTCIFRVHQALSSDLLTAISTEFPQVVNVISGLGLPSYILVDTKHFVGSHNFSIVSRISVSENDESVSNYTTIFEISDNVAPQIFDLFDRSDKMRDDIEALTHLYRVFDDDDFSKVRADKTRQLFRQYIDRYLGRGRRMYSSELSRLPNNYEINADLLNGLDADIIASESYQDFQTALTLRMTHLDIEASRLTHSPISGNIFTLSGQQNVVPNYVSVLCSKISQLKVLYQSERREPIGPADAQRLLSLRVKKGGISSLEFSRQVWQLSLESRSTLLRKSKRTFKSGGQQQGDKLNWM